MKIGIDFHGVIDAKPGLFSKLTRRLRDEGHIVYIITGNELTQDLINSLNDYEISWNFIFSISTYHKQKGTKIWYDEKNTPWMDKEKWDRTKAEYCKKEKIDIHIEDSKTYCLYFTTPYMLIKK